MLKYTREIFAKSFLVTRMWEVLFNRGNTDEDLTLKQLMLLIVAENAFEEPPTIKQVARALTTSHQNAKVLLKQLERKGFAQLFTDPNDKRITRVKVTEGKKDYWKKRQEEDIMMLDELFKDISPQDLETTLKVINQLAQNAETKL